MNTGMALVNTFCTSCGGRLAVGSRFCGTCGTSIETPASINPSTAVPSTGGPAVTPPARPVASATSCAGLSNYYRQEFAKIESSGERYQGKWNWAAFFFGALWALTKGLWVPALIAFVGSIFTGGIVGVIYWVVFAVRGNYMYYRKVARNVNPVY
jgi:hypothetical protein